MNKTVMTCFALALLALPAYAQAASQSSAQSKCNLTEANSPRVRDVRLGMSTEQLVALFPASVKRKEGKEALDRAKAANNETVFISFDPAVDANKGQFAGVSSVTAGIFKGRVMDFSVQYVGSTWANIDEWIEKLSTSFNLPGGREWAVGPSENPNKVLRCNGLEIEGAIQGGGASVRVRNTEYLKEDRADTQEEQKRRDFKP